MSDSWKALLAELFIDADLLARFKAHPAEVLKERGIPVPEGVSLQVHQDTATLRHIVIPHLDADARVPSRGVRVPARPVP